MLSHTTFGGSHLKAQWSSHSLCLFTAMFLLPLDVAHATFHLWSINEIYSSADGSVQFVEFSTTSSGQNLTGSHVITCSGPQGTHTFTIPANLPSSATANKTFIIGTSN